MTLNSKNSTRPASRSTPTVTEDPLQAYIRELHEANNHDNAADKPVRGKDPWIGLLC